MEFTRLQLQWLLLFVVVCLGYRHGEGREGPAQRKGAGWNGR